MIDSHPISDEVLELASLAISNGQNWVAYNRSLYFIGKEDIHFFEEKPLAKNSPQIIKAIGIIFVLSVSILFKTCLEKYLIKEI